MLGWSHNRGIILKKTDVLVIGAGPGGYPAAIRAAQLGKKVIVVEKEVIGGECLNWGCIPSKALISASSLYHKVTHEASEMGIKVEKASVEFKKLQSWKESIIEKLTGGIKLLFKSQKIETVFGTASFLSKNLVEVISEKQSKETIEFESCIVATGASFISLPNLQIDEKTILSAKGLLGVSEKPERLICIGGGVIGIELGTVFAKLGTKLTIVELLPEILPSVDKRLSSVVKKHLKGLGVDIYTSSKAKSLENKNLLVETKDGKIEKIPFDKILVSIGKRANTADLGLSKVGVKTDKRGFILKDTQMKTNIPGIFAVGDCTGDPFLAHKATKEGIIAAEVICGMNSVADFVSIPTAIFSDPEIAQAGLSENQAKDAGLDIVVSRASFGASGRAMSQLETDGFVKLIADRKSGALLGVEMVGPHTSDLVSEIALALELGATAEDLGFTVHPHPTLPEMLMEAAEAIEGKAIHIPNASKPRTH